MSSFKEFAVVAGKMVIDFVQFLVALAIIFGVAFMLTVFVLLSLGVL